MSAFMGMRGTGDWGTDERPKNWRQGILYEYPNGDAPLTALISKLGEQSVDDPEFYWWTKSLPTQAGAITDVFTQADLTGQYTSGGVAGTILYVQVAEATAQHFRPGHQCLFRLSTDYTLDTNAKVISVSKNGASSCIGVKLLEADDNGGETYLASADRILVIGNLNAQGSSMPSAIAYDPTKIYNKTQIFRSALEITRTARMTKLRTTDAYSEAKREALELHSIEMEKAFLWGIMTENTGDNGKPETTTRGLIDVIKTYASANVDDYSLNTDYSGDSWLVSGEDWLDEQLKLIFRYGKRDKLVFAGDGALLALNKLVKLNGNYEISNKTTSYGIKVKQWDTVFGTLNIIVHPLFSYETTNANSMVIFEPSGLKYRYITDTTFYKDPDKQNTGWTRKDGTSEEYLTECGLEFHLPAGWGYLNGVGVDSAV